MRTVKTTDVMFITRLMIVKKIISGGLVAMRAFNLQFFDVNFLLFGGSCA